VALPGLVVLILALGLIVTRSPYKSFGWLCAAVTLTVAADLARGAVLLRDSIMSYTPVDGARYYGIGNEHMGSAISAAVIAAGFLASLLARKRALRMLLLCAVLAVVVVAIGLPSIGANAGGAMSAVAAAAVGLILWHGRRIDRKFAVIAALSVLAALGLLLLVDSMRSGGAQSHVGRAAQLIRSGGAGQILIIIERKVSMNLMLLQHSAWSKLLLASVVAVIALLYSRRLDVLARLRANAFVHSGVIAAAVGALAALLLNDSGVVAAATAFIYVWTAVLLAALPESSNGGQELEPSSPVRASEAHPARSAGQL
jgi:uncharacterized membrane protein